VSDFIKHAKSDEAPARGTMSNKRTNTGSLKALKHMIEGEPGERRNL